MNNKNGELYSKLRKPKIKVKYSNDPWTKLTFETLSNRECP